MTRNLRRCSTLCLTLALLLLATLAEADDGITADILLQGATLHLGDGTTQQGDLALRDDKIVAVGSFEVAVAKRRIDCTGWLICPGFIDLHNHSDRQIVDRKTRACVNYLTQGCTTIVTGNCGSGPVDAGKYYQQIEEQGAGVNVAHLLPQGSLRREVIGSDRTPADAAALDKMRQLAARAMKDGTWGMSTGLIYVPSSYADTKELAAIAKVVGQHGGIYASHIRNENTGLLGAIDEALEIGERGQLPVHVSHFKSSGKNAWGIVRIAVDRIESARRKGRRVTADQYPYTASSTSLDATLIPSWARAGGRSQLLKRLDDDQEGPRILAAIDKKLVELDDGQRVQIAYFGSQPDWAGKRLAELARSRKESSRALALHIIRKGGASIVNHSINEDDVRFVMQRPWVATASDGRAYLPGPTVPHPRNYGTFPRKIGHYAIGEKAIPLADAIRSASGLPADILGLPKRGYVRVGYAADVLVLDPATVTDTATFSDPHQHARGVQYLFVNGQPAVERGVPTGNLAGRPLRHTPAAAAEPSS